MSIWNIVEYKPRAPQAQGNLQSAYTVESDRVKPDLAAGFRVQHSDQNQFPNNSFLFLENAARLPQMDPYAWGDKYENILQVKEDYNRGFIPTLDCLSVRQQSQVSADGVPINPPPPSQPVEPTAVTQNNSNHGGDFKDATKNAIHENNVKTEEEKQFESRRNLYDSNAKIQTKYPSESNMISNYDQTNQSSDTRSWRSKSLEGPPALEEVKSKKGGSFFGSVINAITYPFRRNSASNDNEYKDSTYPMREKEKERQQNEEIGNLSNEEIATTIQSKLKIFSQDLSLMVVEQGNLNRAQIIDKISIYQDSVSKNGRDLANVVVAVNEIDKNQQSLVNIIQELKNDLKNIANRKSSLQYEKQSMENELKVSGNDPMQIKLLSDRVSALTASLNQVVETNKQGLDQLDGKLSNFQQDISAKVIQLDNVSQQLFRVSGSMKSSFETESKAIMGKVDEALFNFQQPILDVFNQTKQEISNFKNEVKNILADSGNLQAENRRKFEEIGQHLSTFLNQVEKVIANSESRIVGKLTPYLQASRQGQMVSIMDLAIEGFDKMLQNQASLGKYDEDLLKIVQDKFQLLDNSLKSLSGDQQYIAIQNTLNEIKNNFPQLSNQIDVIQTSLATYASQLDQLQTAQPTYNTADNSGVSVEENPKNKRKLQSALNASLSNEFDQYLLSQNYVRSGGFINPAIIPAINRFNPEEEKKSNDVPPSYQAPSTVQSLSIPGSPPAASVASVASPQSPRWVQQLPITTLRSYASQNGIRLQKYMNKDQIYQVLKNSGANVISELQALHSNPKNRMKEFQRS